MKSEDLTVGAKRLRYSYDIEFEVDKLDTIMEESLKVNILSCFIFSRCTKLKVY